MARPTLRTHRKFIRLARVLGSHLLALGALQTLWDSCYESGDDRVGTAADVAYVIGWTDKKIDIATAMHEAGFLDADAEHPDEFVVHDLWDHAPEYVAKRRKREIERQTRGADLRRPRRHAAPNGGQTAPDVGQTAPNGSTPAPAPAPAPAQRGDAADRRTFAPLSQAELQEQSPREQLFEHWRDVAAAHGVLEPLTRTPKECHQAATLLDVHALDALRGAVTAFWDSASFDGKRSFGMFANQAPQLVAHVKAGKPYPFGAPPRIAEKAAREAKLDAWTPPVPRQAVAR